MELILQKIEAFELKYGAYHFKEGEGNHFFSLEDDCEIAPDFSSIFEA